VVRWDRTNATLGYKPLTAGAWSCTRCDLGGSCCCTGTIEAACGADQSSSLDHRGASSEAGDSSMGHVRLGRRRGAVSAANPPLIQVPVGARAVSDDDWDPCPAGPVWGPAFAGAWPAFFRPPRGAAPYSGFPFPEGEAAVPMRLGSGRVAPRLSSAEPQPSVDAGRSGESPSGRPV
jgi:hypothetical protein